MRPQLETGPCCGVLLCHMEENLRFVDVGTSDETKAGKRGVRYKANGNDFDTNKVLKYYVANHM